MARSYKRQELADTVVRWRMPGDGEADADCCTNPNQWFADKFPEQTQQYGPAFMEATFADADGLTRFIPGHLNEDFFAAILGGDGRLGHRLVYFPPEDAFYFYDYGVDAYCPTSEEKLKLLFSNYLVRCSQACGALVDITHLVVKFRQGDVLSNIISKSKAVLQTERCYFEGPHGKRRYVDGKYIEPNEEPSYQQFVNKAIIRHPEAKLTVADAFHRYYQFCKDNAMKPLTRPEFKDLVAEVIREQFNLGLRHDVPSAQGKQGHGWFGIDCRLNDLASCGRN